MGQKTVQVPVRVQGEKPVSYDVDIKTTSNGGESIHLSNDDLSIVLFESKAKPKEGSGSRIKYNATITLKGSGVTFQTAVKELLTGENKGQLIAGQSSRMNGKRSVINEWDKDKNQSYERMSIPSELYATIIAMIADATK
jgi:hypothetical protein